MFEMSSVCSVLGTVKINLHIFQFPKNLSLSVGMTTPHVLLIFLTFLGFDVS